jgi:alkanesulfonate monooxygenase SsuD/methylene tetrahydromethanopterin reductase-like flavin-dependent oxidoreductase (luciferase family)
VKIGLTLPSFVDDPEKPIAVARAAEAAGIDGVFVFDHIFRDAPSRRRPALECFALLGAIAAETERVHVGPLVARATLRPPAVLAHSFDAVQRVSNGRVIAGIGAGDHLTREENESYGVMFGTMADRIDALHAAVRAARGRGYPVWIGGRAAQVRELVALADGWNHWGCDALTFGRDSDVVREVHPEAVLTWGGLVSLAETQRDADDKAARIGSANAIAGTPERVAERLAAYVDAGAQWVILGPIDSTNVQNCALIGEGLRTALTQ